MTFGTHGSTYGGNPLAMAAGNAVLDAVDEEFLAAVREKGEKMWEVMVRNLVELVEDLKGMTLEEIYERRY